MAVVVVVVLVVLSTRLCCGFRVTCPRSWSSNRPWHGEGVTAVGEVVQGHGLLLSSTGIWKRQRHVSTSPQCSLSTRKASQERVALSSLTNPKPSVEFPRKVARTTGFFPLPRVTSDTNLGFRVIRKTRKRTSAINKNNNDSNDGALVDRRKGDRGRGRRLVSNAQSTVFVISGRTQIIQ